MKKLIATALIGASAIFAASAVSAATLTTFDSNLKMETPNDNWKEISDPDTIITLTDGRDKVTVKEFRKDDEIPMPIISFDDFEEIYQTYYSTADTVYMITGFAQTRNDIDEVRSVVESIQLVDHQKPEEKKEQKQEPQKPVQPEQIVRTGNNMQLFYLNSNSVTVYEYTDGSWMDDQGIVYWTTVEHEWANSEGSVLYDYIPELPTAEPTGEVRTIFYLTGNGKDIKGYTDGSWLDSNGVSYFSNGDGTWTSSLGETLYDDDNALMNLN